MVQDTEESKKLLYRRSTNPLPHHPTKNTRRTPALWLSIFHFCTLHRSFLFVRSYYYYQGNFSSHTLTQRVPLPQQDGVGVSRHFSDRGRTSPSSSGGGGISHRPRCMYRNDKFAFHLPETRRGLFVRYPFLKDGLIKFQILSHLAQPPFQTNSSIPKWNTRSFEEKRRPQSIIKRLHEYKKVLRILVTFRVNMTPAAGIKT